MGTPSEILIDAPLELQIVQRPQVLVRGVVRNSTGLETAVTVNGLTALQYEDQFMVNQVPLVEGENVLTVTAADTSGATHSVELVVYAQIGSHHCTATTAPAMGLSPYKGELRLSATADLIYSNVLDYGPADVKYGLGPPELIPLTIAEPGLYRFEVEAEIPGGMILYDEVAVLVNDTDKLDALLRAKWNAMKACLAAGDVDGAVNHIGNAVRADYHALFTAQGATLTDLAAGMQDIEMVQAGYGFAKYRINRDEVIQGQTYSITYDIYFGTDEKGIWKIERF